jgi:hypothetical protein
MSDEQETKRSDADAELEREIRLGRGFNLADAIGRMAGPGAMKGASPVSRKQQAAVEIEMWLERHAADAGEEPRSYCSVGSGRATSCSRTLISRSLL